jgi:group I intron endonuclease
VNNLVIVYGVIYKATNLINNKIYIGQTINFKSRINSHSRKFDTKCLYNAIKKYGKENFKWEIIDSASSKQELDFKEILYIMGYNSYSHANGYNISMGGEYSTKGKVAVKDENNNYYLVSQEEYRSNPKLTTFSNGKITAKNKDNKIVYVSKQEFDSNPDLVGVTKGLTIMKDKNGNIFQVDKSDPRIKSGELFGINKGKLCVIDENGISIQVYTNDPRYLSGKLKSNTTGNVLVKDFKHPELGNFWVKKDDPKYKNGTFVHYSKGMVVVKDKTGRQFRANIDDPKIASGEYIKVTSSNIDMIVVRDKNGKQFQINRNDPRYLSGELVHYGKDKILIKDKDGKQFRVFENDSKYISGEYIKV